MPPIELVAIDKWIKAQLTPKPTRPEGIRRLVQMGLASAQPTPTRTSKKTAVKASEMAGRMIDYLVDQSAPAEVREKRKRRLLKGPSEFREMRADLQKPKG